MSPTEFWLGIFTLGLSVYVVFNTLDFSGSRCCFSFPKVKREHHTQIMWGEELTSIAGNPRLLLKEAMILFISELDRILGVRVFTERGYIQSLGAGKRLILAVRLMYRCGFFKGLKLFNLFQDSLSAFPEMMEDSIYLSLKLVEGAEVIKLCRKKS